MKEPFLVVFGHTAVDVLIRVKELPVKNVSVAVKNRMLRYGGTGANIAKAAQDMGVPTRLVSYVGDDFTQEYSQHLKGCGIDTRYIKRVDGGLTPTCYMLTDDNHDQMALMDQGAMAQPEYMYKGEDIVEGCGRIHIGTGPPEYYRSIVELAERKGIPVGFDPSQELTYVYTPETFVEILEKSDIFFCNENEFLRALEYVDGSSYEDLLVYTGAVVKTRGSKGSTLYSDSGKREIPPYSSEKCLDPTGAGDAYRGGFYAGVFRGLDMSSCCSLGSARASFALEFNGPQEGKVGWEDVKLRMKKGHK